MGTGAAAKAALQDSEIMLSRTEKVAYHDLLVVRNTKDGGVEYSGTPLGNPFAVTEVL